MFGNVTISLEFVSRQTFFSFRNLKIQILNSKKGKNEKRMLKNVPCNWRKII